MQKSATIRPTEGHGSRGEPMSRILVTCAAIAVTVALALSGPAQAAERRADGVRAAASAMTDVSAYRYWGHRRWGYWGRPFWRPRYAFWGPRYAWGPRVWHRPYWRPYGFYRPYGYWRPWWRPRPFVGWGWGRRWWW